MKESPVFSGVGCFYQPKLTFAKRMKKKRGREREQSICLGARDDPGIVMQVAFTSRVVGRMSLGKVDS